MLAKKSAGRRKPQRSSLHERYMRVASALSTIVCTGRKGDGRIRLQQLANIQGTLLHDSEQFKTVRSYLKGLAAPQAFNAWTLGEALHQAGCVWSSGLLMLWFCGHFADAIGTVASYVDAQPASKVQEAMEITWSMLTSAPMLMLTSELDAVEPFPKLHTREPEMSAHAAQELDSWKTTNPQNLTPSELDYIDGRYRAREFAKIDWLPYGGIRPAMDHAFKRWISSARVAPSLGNHEMLQASLGIANASGVPLKERELGSLAVLAFWSPHVSNPADTFSRSLGVWYLWDR